MKAMRYKIALLLSVLSLPAMLLVATGGPAAAAPHHSAAGAVKSSSLGSFKPTFTGSAATGCAGLSPAHRSVPHSVYGASVRQPGTERTAKSPDGARAMPLMRPRVPHVNGPAVKIPTVSCQPLRPGCDNISSFAGGSTGVKGINAVDSAMHSAIPLSLRTLSPRTRACAPVTGPWWRPTTSARS